MAQDSDNDPLQTGGALGVLAGISADETDPILGRTLGDYEILELIAAGGMGRVYRARRADGSFEREVAVKVSAASGLSEELRSRFAQEQTVLAGLNHPHVCQLYDAQVTAEGWPYIVMELVDGQSIVDYSAARQLEAAQRLQLMIEVVDAVAYAHSRLVVHRDIKPANVLVSDDGHVKLLDFGIAKLLESEQALTRATPLTPKYASPEQLLGQPITVASDIYQLGLLLFEVMTGEAAADTASLTESIQRAAGGQTLTLPAASRARLDKELVLIIEQCLRVDPEDRYRSANGLLDDLTALRDGYPVAAAGQGGGYRFRKFLQRNAAAATIAAIAVTGAIGGTAWYTYQLDAARDEAERQAGIAEESLEFLAGMFDAANPSNAQDRELSAIDVLDLGAERIETELVDQPEIQEKLYFTLGRTYWSLGELEKADIAASRLLEIANSLYGDALEPQFEALNLLANVKGHRGEAELSMRMFEELRVQAEEQLGADHPTTLKVMNNLAVGYSNAGRIEDAKAIYEDVFTRKARVLGRGDQSTLATAVNLIQVNFSAGQAERAASIGRGNLAIAEDALGELHPTTLNLLDNTAGALRDVEGLDAAAPYYEEALRRSEIVFGPDNFNVARRKARLAGIYADSGQLDRAEPMEREAVETMIQLRGADHPGVLTPRANYATTLGMMGRYDEVLEQIPEIIELQQDYFGPTHPSTLYSRIVMADALLNTGDPAGPVYARSVADDIAANFETGHWLFASIDPVLQLLESD